MKKLLDVIIIYIFLALILIFALAFFISNSKNIFNFEVDKKISFLQIKQKWTDSVLDKLSIDEKISQLILYKIDTNNLAKENLDFIIKNNIGGIVLENIDNSDKLQIINYLQSQAKIPLLIYERNQNSESHLTLATQNSNELITTYFMLSAKVIKNKAINIQEINIADTYTNSDNNYLFFNNQSRDSIIDKIANLQYCLDSNNVIFSINNFNCFFDTKKDTLNLTDSILYTFKKLSQTGIAAIVLNKNIVQNFSYNDLENNELRKFLAKNIDFEGLVISEPLYFKDIKQSAEHSLRIASDLIIINNDFASTHLNIRNLIEDKKISLNELDKIVKKVLMAKKWTATNYIQNPNIDTINNIAKTEENLFTLRKFYEKSFILLKNNDLLIPYTDVYKNFLNVVIGDSLHEFNNFLNFYTKVEIKNVQNINDFKYSLTKDYNNIIIAINDYIIDNKKDTTFINELKILLKNKKIKTLIVNFKNIQNIKLLSDCNNIVQVFENKTISQNLCAQYLFGAFSSDAKLVTNLSNDLKINNKAITNNIKRLKYTIPIEAKMSAKKLAKIDSIVENAIQEGAFPGCQILVIKQGNVVYYNSFGHHTYEKTIKTKITDLYDLASITKVAATTLICMKLYENKVFKLTDTIKYFLQDTINLKFKNHQIADFLLHQTGLPAFMPVAKYIVHRESKKDGYKDLFATEKDTTFSLQVAEDLFFNKNYMDTIYRDIFNLNYDTTKAYNYSDVNFNVLYKIVTNLINTDFETFLANNFYAPLGMQTIGFRPLERFDKDRITPTQDDKYWRKQLLCGYVHDESAALNNCTWGNAGLFADANDLAILFQMLLNSGTYAGVKYFDKETIDLFTSPVSDSQRGYGFAMASYKSFGHTGFTGTCVWASKTHNIIYIFLSNRVHPKMMNKKLHELNVREQIFDIIINSNI